MRAANWKHLCARIKYSPPKRGKSCKEGWTCAGGPCDQACAARGQQRNPESLGHRKEERKGWRRNHVAVETWA